MRAFVAVDTGPLVAYFDSRDPAHGWKYADTPMDVADATLVLPAEALGHNEILTLDRRGFPVFRTRRGRPYRRVLDGRS